MSAAATLTMRETGSGVPDATTIRDLLNQLAHRAIGTADAEDAIDADALQREAREIVSTLLRVSPGEVARRQDDDVDATVIAQALSVSERRSRGEPLAYAIGSAAFRHLELNVDRRVLIPRPETEIVVDHALRVALTQPGGIAADIGTGSGAIAIALATEGRFDRVIATDISQDAIDLATVNRDRVFAERESTGRSMPAALEFRLGSDFEPLRGIKANLVVSNPPYIAHEEAASLPSSVRQWEPALALFADDGGMARYNALLSGAREHLVPGGWLVLELDSRRGQETARRAGQTGFFSRVEVHPDLTGRDRVLLAQLKSDISPD